MSTGKWIAGHATGHTSATAGGGQLSRQIVERSPRALARIAGLWYLLLAVCAYFTFFVDSTLYVSGDAVATAAKILARTSLFRLGIVSDLVGEAGFLFSGLAFYRLFASVDGHQARTLLAVVVASVPIAFLVTLNKFAPIILLGDAGFLKAFEPAQLQALAMLFIELQKYGILIVSVFWGLWLLPLGILAYKSGFFPRIFGVLLIVNFASYMVNEFLAFLFPEAKQLIAPVMTVLLAIGEIPFLFWLLIRGARNTERAQYGPQ